MANMLSQKELLALVESFLKMTGISARAFGTKVNGNPALVWALRKGREPKERTRETIVNYIKAHPSDGA